MVPHKPNLNLLGLESNRLMKDDGIEIITDDNMRHVNRREYNALSLLD